MALLLAHRTGEHAANLGPDPVVVKPIMPGPDGLPGAKILRQVAPSAASLVQIQTGVDHLAHVRRQRLVNRKMRRDCLPLGIRQVAQIAPPVVLVAFAMFRRPHGMLLLVHQQRTTGGSGRSLISSSVKQALNLRQYNAAGRPEGLDPGYLGNPGWYFTKRSGPDGDQAGAGHRRQGQSHDQLLEAIRSAATARVRRPTDRYRP